MNQFVVVIANKTPLFAHFLKELGLNVCCVRRRISEIKGKALPDCEALYWDMESMSQLWMCHLLRSMLQNIPEDSVKIMDFNLKEPNVGNLHLITLALKCCDLLKIDSREFSIVCQLLGIVSRHQFDNGFELMRQYQIKTLILTYGTQGSRVFHDGAVSERWGIMTRESCQSEVAESAFLAAFYAASRQSDKPFSECHRQALGYMQHFMQTLNCEKNSVK